jgi:hypothetical protein
MPHKTPPAIIESVVVGNDASKIIMTASQWTELTLVKQTGGTLAIGTVSNIRAQSSGGGILLVTGEPFSIRVPPGTTIWGIGSGADEAVGVYKLLMEFEPQMLTLQYKLAGEDPPELPMDPPSAHAFPGEKDFHEWVRSQKGQ